MNKRCILIVNEVIENGGVGNYKDLSISLGVSERTVRYDVERINEELLRNNLKGISKSLKGGFIIGDILKLKKSLKKNDFDFDSESRESLILVEVLFENSININDLCEEFGLSRSTVKTSLKNIKLHLNSVKLQLILLPRKGLQLEGEEEDIRSEQLKVLNKYLARKDDLSYQDELISEKLEAFLVRTDEKFCSEFVLKLVQLLGKVISDGTHKILVNYLRLLILRCKKNHHILSVKNEVFFKSTLEYTVVKKHISVVEAKYQIHISDYEIIKLVDHLMGIQSYSLDHNFYHDWMEIEPLVKKVIKCFESGKKIDITKDATLFKGLLNHIKPTTYRIKNNIQLQNSIYEDLIKENEGLYLSTYHALDPLRDFLQQEIPKDEVAFIALHFKSAINREIKKNKNKVNVLIVCGLGYGTSKLLEEQVINRYSVTVEKIIPYNQLTNYNLDNIDLVITTLRENQFSIDIPVASINVFLSEEDTLLLENLGLEEKINSTSFSSILKVIKSNTTTCNENKLKSELKELMGDKLFIDEKKQVPKLSEFLPKNNIFLNIYSQTWEEAIEVAGRALEATGSTTHSYTLDMLDKVREYGSYFVTSNGLALPHALNKGNSVIKTGMVLLTFENPILFPDNVSVSYILAFSSVDNLEHLDALSSFLDLVNNHNFFEKVSHDASPKKIVDLIKKYEFLSRIGR